MTENLQKRWQKRHTAIANLQKYRETSQQPRQTNQNVALSRNNTTSTTVSTSNRYNLRSRQSHTISVTDISTTTTTTISKAQYDGMKGRYQRTKNENETLKNELQDAKMQIAILKLEIMNKKSTESIIEDLTDDINMENECIKTLQKTKYVFILLFS